MRYQLKNNVGLDWNARLVSGIKVPASLSFWTLRNEGIIILLVFWPRSHQNWTLFITFFWHIIVILNISETCHHLNILDAHVFFGCSLGAQSHVEVLIRVSWWQHFTLFVSSVVGSSVHCSECGPVRQLLHANALRRSVGRHPDNRVRASIIHHMMHEAVHSG